MNRSQGASLAVSVPPGVAETAVIVPQDVHSAVSYLDGDTILWINLNIKSKTFLLLSMPTACVTSAATRPPPAGSGGRSAPPAPGWRRRSWRGQRRRTCRQVWQEGGRQGAGAGEGGKEGGSMEGAGVGDGGSCGGRGRELGREREGDKAGDGGS